MNDSLAPGPLAVRRVGRVLTYRKAATVALLFPPAGVPAMMHSMRAARLASEGQVEAARREGERARDWSWYAVGIGLSVYIVAFLVWLLTTNDHAVSRGVLRTGRPTDGGAWRSLLKGFWINVQVFLIAEVIVLVWALVVAVMRLLAGPGVQARSAFLATVYVDMFRGMPALLVILIVGFGLPQATCRSSAVSPTSTTRSLALGLDVRRVRVRGVPRRHRVDPLEPDRRGPLAGPHLRRRRCATSSCRRPSAG